MADCRSFKAMSIYVSKKKKNGGRKGVSFAIPGSEEAIKAGFSQIGCYTVKLFNPTRVIAAYAHKKDAIAHAKRLPGKFTAWSLT